MAETGDAAEPGTGPPPVSDRVRASRSDRPRSPAPAPEAIDAEVFERVADLLAGRAVGPGDAGVAGELADAAGSEDPWSAVGVLHDFLDDRLARGELSREECRRLRDRLVSLSRTVAEERIASERRRSHQLAAGVARDVRSTLHSIVFLAEALHSGHSGSLSDRQRRQVGVVYSASTSLLNLVDGLVDWARVTRQGSREAERFSVPEAVARVRGLARPIAESQGARFSTEILGCDVCRGDPDVVTRVALNLVANALAAVGRDGWVELRVECREDGLRLEVRDSADGCQEEIEWLAALLERSEPPDVAACLGDDGYGLSLCICSALVAEAGGEARVEASDDRDGRRIAVSFPFSGVAEPGD